MALSIRSQKKDLSLGIISEEMREYKGHSKAARVLLITNKIKGWKSKERDKGQSFQVSDDTEILDDMELSLKGEFFLFTTWAKRPFLASIVLK